jgi:transposase-like protein
MTLPLLKSVNRRRFSAEFKRQLIEQCQPGISVAGVALIHSINPNLLHRWIRSHRTSASIPQTPAQVITPPITTKTLNTASSQAVKFIPAIVNPNTEPHAATQLANTANPMIDITLKGKTGDVSLRWPVSAASALAPLLATLLT